jgi:hypothetical protein
LTTKEYTDLLKHCEELQDHLQYQLDLFNKKHVKKHEMVISEVLLNSGDMGPYSAEKKRKSPQVFETECSL